MEKIQYTKLLWIKDINISKLPRINTT